MRAVVIQHERNEGPGLFGPALEAVGFTLVERFRAVDAADVDADLVVVLGGSMSAFDVDTHPFLGEEIALLSARLRDDAPCLGICLGAQLLARAAGATGFRGEAGLEVGALPVTWTDEGLADGGLEDEVLAERERELVVAHWHQDTFGAVPGATLLASSARYEQQAFRRGRSYGLQFHLELTADALRSWLDVGSASLEAQGIDVAQLEDLAAFEAHGDRRRRHVQRLASAFARWGRSGS